MAWRVRIVFRVERSASLLLFFISLSLFLACESLWLVGTVVVTSLLGLHSRGYFVS